MKALNYCCKALLLRCLGESWIRYTSEKFTQSAYCFLGNISKVEHSFFVFYYLPIKYILTETLKLRELEKKWKTCTGTHVWVAHIFSIFWWFSQCTHEYYFGQFYLCLQHLTLKLLFSSAEERKDNLLDFSIPICKKSVK